MLYERWRDIAREFRNENALRDLASGEHWTFAQLDDAAAKTTNTPALFPQGNTAQFVIDVLRAWRNGALVCPLENGQSPPEFPLPPENVVHLKTTSATTGAPKLVAFTAAQLAADADNIVATMNLRPDRPNLAFISLAHSYGFSNLITPLLLHGIPLILGGPPLPEMVRRAAGMHNSVTLAAVPALWRVWHDANAISPNVRLAVSAGAALPVALEREVFERRGLKIHNFYGASECGGIAYDATETPRGEDAFVGQPMHNVSLAATTDGCLEVRGPNVAETYWPEASPLLANGCYRTADLAELKTGAVFLRGRASDVINVAGRKISPESIERLLMQHEGVRDCLVFGVPSDNAERGERIVACIVARNGVSAESLRSFMLQRGEAWQSPRQFWFVESLEANQRGKLSRAEWRRKFLERQECSSG